MEIVLLLVGALMGWGVSRYYYVQAKRDSESSEAKREAKESWRRSVNYFEHMLTSAKWDKRYIANVVTWVCPADLTLKIVIPDSHEDFIEAWTERFPDPKGRRTDIQLRINDSAIAELPFIHLDGGRILVPMPRQVFLESTPCYFRESDSVEFKVGQIVGHYYIHNSIESIAKISGIAIVRGRAEA